MLRTRLPVGGGSGRQWFSNHHTVPHLHLGARAGRRGALQASSAAPVLVCASSRWRRSGWVAVLKPWGESSPAPLSRPRASCSARMGLQQSRQACALPKPAAEPPAPPPERYDGLIPRSLTARQACNARRVRRLIRAGRLAPCFDESLSGAEGEVRGPAPRSCGLPAPIAARYCTLAPAAAGAPAARDHPPSVNFVAPTPSAWQECPVCMEHYRRLNSTACCQQDICECVCGSGEGCLWRRCRSRRRAMRTNR